MKNPHSDKSFQFTDKISRRVRRNELANVRSGYLAHLFQAPSIFPCAIHRLIQKFHGRGLCEEAIDAISDQLAISANVSDDARTAAKHGFHNCQGHSLMPRWKDQSVMPAPNLLDIVLMARKLDIRQIQRFGQPKKPAPAWSASNHGHPDVAIPPMRQIQDLEQ